MSAVHPVVGPVRFALRCVGAHTATYLACGLFASWALDYAAFWQTDAMQHMRPLDSPWVASGPGLQILRGLVLGAALWPFRVVFLSSLGGALRLWALLVGIGILSTYGPAPGSIEGVIYTAAPLSTHLWGLPEVIAQSGAFALCLVGWHRHPARAWSIVLGGGTGLAVLASIAGAMLG